MSSTPRNPNKFTTTPHLMPFTMKKSQESEKH